LHGFSPFYALIEKRNSEIGKCYRFAIDAAWRIIKFKPECRDGVARGVGLVCLVGQPLECLGKSKRGKYREV